jgi:aspartyl/glutamyl-tRNA(Asn/Gln) amidotransferase C subunit
MQISKDQVKKISKLVNLNLNEEETSRLSEMFSDTLDKMKVLEELDTSSVTETYSVTGTTNVFSDPILNNATLSKEKALSGAHENVNGLFATKAVFDRE